MYSESFKNLLNQFILNVLFKEAKSRKLSPPCSQRWAQIHQNVFKIKIQNTVLKKILCEKMYLNTNTLSL